MPKGGKGKPAGGYRAGGKGTSGCSGYPTVSADGTVHGCHPTKAQAQAQARAIWASTAQKFVKSISKGMVTEGDYVMFICEEDEIKVGQVEFVMSEGTYGLTGSEYAMEATPEDPVLSIRVFEEEDGSWEATEEIRAHKASETVKIESLMVSRDVVEEMYSSTSPEETMMDPVDAYDASIGKSECCPDEISKQAPCWDGYVQRGMKPGQGGKMVPNCVPAAKADDLFEDDDTVVYETDSLEKAEGYSPPAGARSAARRAIKFKEDGKANGAGTPVGWTRAGQLARGETISLSTVKRMYSYFSRHEVDKKGKDWANQSNPSNGYIMWLAWGGDAGFAWSRSIVNREKDKALFADFGKDYTKTQTDRYSL